MMNIPPSMKCGLKNIKYTPGGQAAINAIQTPFASIANPSKSDFVIFIYLL